MRSRASILAVFGFGSISLLSSACTETDIDPIVAAPKPLATSAPLSQSGPMDVLFVIDDSSSMADKQQYLGEAAASFLNRLASPSCVDTNHNVVGTSTDGVCATGALAYVPVTDIHVGIVSTSLGLGAPDDSSQCANLHAHLVSGIVTGKQPTLDPKTQVFSWTKGSQDVAQLAKDVSASVIGMGESGCGIEMQLESWYRFLVQPDPYQKLAWAAGAQESVVYQGIDDDLLAQRKAFLRPNSTVAVVMLTDENDSSIDPLALSGTAWNLLSETFVPPNPTSACATDPTSIACTSCAFVDSSSDANCAQAPTPSATDALNTRFFHAKQRFGVDPQYPVSRYANGLSSPRVPDRAHEHLSFPLTGELGYVGEPDCDNPLFAAELPANSSEDICNLPRGSRGASQIFFTVIAGVPHQLLQQDPLDANSPLKSNLSAADYRTLLGDDPLAYRFDGVDAHMLESMSPRAGISAGDPIVLGDWNTKGLQIEHACTFLLPEPIDQGNPAFAGECTSSSADDTENDAAGNPNCAQDGSQRELYASATPAVRELSVARALGNQAVVSSICPIHFQIDGADAGTTTSPAISNTTQDPLFGYEPA
ncbi:MAG: hypothetical protein ABI421_22745, partial [Polyangiaceae bacterium]